MERSRTFRKPSQRIADAAIILSVAAALTYTYLQNVDLPSYDGRWQLHEDILSGAAQSPYRYRLFAPVFAECVRRTLALFIVDQDAFVSAWGICDFLAITFTLLALYQWLRSLFPRASSLCGVLFVAATMPIAFQDHGFQPWSLFEPGFVALACLYASQQKLRMFLIAIAIASFNRETAVFLPVIWVLIGFSGRKDWPAVRKPAIEAGYGFLVWLSVFVGLRIALGYAPHALTIHELWARNTQVDSLRLSLVHGILFLGFGWLLAAFGTQHAPPPIRRLALFVFPYLATVAVWGVWYEVRLLMPLYPVLLPLLLYALFDDEERSAATGSL